MQYTMYEGNCRKVMFVSLSRPNVMCKYALNCDNETEDQMI